MRERLDYLASNIIIIIIILPILPEEWNLEPDEFLPVTQYRQKYFNSSSWLIVEKG